MSDKPNPVAALKRLRSVAHVGHSGTPDDMARSAKAFDWLMYNGYALPERSDFIDLNAGRDFLREKKQYDAVVLHFLFRGDGHCGSAPAKFGPLAESPRCGWSAWRKKLVATKARVIILFGGMAEVGGSYVVDLAGYNRVHFDEGGIGGRSEQDTTRMTVFEIKP